jgi:hypothetical protein
MDTEQYQRELDAICETMTLQAWRTPKMKLANACTLLLEGGVTPGEQDDTYLVRSTSDADKVYTVSLKGCTCDAGRHGNKYCTHAAAVEIYTRHAKEKYLANMPKQEQKTANDQEGAQEAPGSTQTPNATPKSSQKENVAGETIQTSNPMPSSAMLPLQLPRRSIQAIIADLSRPLPEACVAHRKQGGQDIGYLHWQHVARVLDTYAPGWSGHIVEVKVIADPGKDGLTGDKVMVTYRLTIPAAEGLIAREATGQEDVEMVEEYTDSRSGEVKKRRAYGDSTSNAEAMAFKRAAAKFGLGAWLYNNDATAEELRKHLDREKADLLKLLEQSCARAGVPVPEVRRWLRGQTGAQSSRDVPASAIRALLGHLATLPTVDAA